MIVADIQPIQNLRVLKKQTGNAKEWATFWIENGFQGAAVIHVPMSGANICAMPSAGEGGVQDSGQILHWG